MTWRQSYLIREQTNGRTAKRRCAASESRQVGKGRNSETSGSQSGNRRRLGEGARSRWRTGLVRFCDLWRKDRLEPPEALRQAQLWLRDTNNSQKKEYFQIALPEFEALRLTTEDADVFIKAVGLNKSSACSFAHLFHLAGFAYTGV